MKPNQEPVPAAAVDGHPFDLAFAAWARQGLRPCLMRADPAARFDRDEIDVLFPANGLRRACAILEGLGWETLETGLFGPSRRHLVVYHQDRFLKFDLYAHLIGGGLYYLSGDAFVTGAIPRGHVWFPANGEFLFHLVMNTVLEKEVLRPDYRPRLEAAAGEQGAFAAARTRGAKLGLESLFDRDRRFTWLDQPEEVRAARTLARSRMAGGANWLRRLHHSAMQRVGKRLGLRRGCSLAFIGPDGAGKSSFIAALQTALERLGIRTALVYMGPWERPVLASSRFLRRLGASPLDIDSLSPVLRNPVKRAKAYVRRGLYYLNFVPEMWARYLSLVRPEILQRKVVLLDRHAYDLEAGYYNQPIGNAPRLRRLLVRLCPRPEATILLDNDAAVIWARKREFPLELITGALGRYRDLASRDGLMVIRTDCEAGDTAEAFLRQHWRELVRWRRDGLWRPRRLGCR
jgi:thymidylate kinase